MKSQSEAVGGEQIGQTAQPLVANQNDQNVKSPAATKTTRNPGKGKKCRCKNKGKGKKCRGKKKQETGETSDQNVKNIERQLDNMRTALAESNNTNAYSNGQLDKAKEDMELIKECFSILQQVVTQQHAWMNMLQPLLVGGSINQFGATMEAGGPVFEESLPQSHQVERAHLIGGSINQFGATMESGGPVFEESLPQSHQVERAHCNNVEQPAFTYDGLTYDGYPSHTSLLIAAMQGSLAPGGQARVSPVFEVTGSGTGETGLAVHHPPVYQSGTTMGSGGLAIEDSPGLPQSHVSQGLTHNLQLPSFGIGDQGSTSFLEECNNVEQPGLTYGGLTCDDVLNYTSLPGAAMASGSSLMQGSLAPGGQLPSFGIGDQGSTSFLEDMDYLMNLGIASHECHRQETESVLEPPSPD